MRLVPAAALCLSLTAQTALACAADAMVVFDASASMNSQDFDANTTRRIDEARAAMAEIMPRIEHTRRIGLIAYGPGGGPCDGISYRFSPVPDAAARLMSELRAIRPGGLTPLTEAVRLAAGVLGPDPGVVVLVTDGAESCGGSPCDLAYSLPATLTVHVIGFKLLWNAFASHSTGQQDSARADLTARCLADRTGGRFVATETVQDLVAALEATLGCLRLGQTEPIPATRAEPA